MNRYLAITAIALSVSVALGGCVSSSTHEKLVADKDQEIAKLQKEKMALEQKNVVLETSSKESQEQYTALVQKLSAEVQQGQLKVRQYQNMLYVDVAEQIFFDSGNATLKDTGKEVLKKVGEALKSYNNKMIRVAGYTDNVPIAKSMQTVYPTNWELSVTRATNVVRFLQEVGVPPERLSAAGHGEYAPIATNDTPEGRQKNRRIEIMLIDQSLVGELTKPKQ